jgi:hypothetical protein
VLGDLADDDRGRGMGIVVEYAGRKMRRGDKILDHFSRHCLVEQLPAGRHATLEGIECKPGRGF